MKIKHPSLLLLLTLLCTGDINSKRQSRSKGLYIDYLHTLVSLSPQLCNLGQTRICISDAVNEQENITNSGINVRLQDVPPLISPFTRQTNSFWLPAADMQPDDCFSLRDTFCRF